MYRYSIYLFVFTFYPLIVNQCLFRNQLSKYLTFSLMMMAAMLTTLVGLGMYYDKIDILYWNIVLIMIMATVFIVCWLIRKWFSPKFFRDFDIDIIDDPDRAESVIDGLSNTYKNNVKGAFIVSIIFCSIITVLNMMELTELNIGDPLPYIWVGVILLATYFSNYFCIKKMEKGFANGDDGWLQKNT